MSLLFALFRIHAANTESIVLNLRVDARSKPLKKNDILILSIVKPDTYILFSQFKGVRITSEYQQQQGSSTVISNVYTTDTFTVPFLDFTNYYGFVTIEALEDTVVTFAAYRTLESNQCDGNVFVANSLVDIEFNSNAGDDRKLTPNKLKCAFVHTDGIAKYKIDNKLEGDSMLYVTTDAENEKTYRGENNGETVEAKAFLAIINPRTQGNNQVHITTTEKATDPIKAIGEFVSPGQTRHGGLPTQSSCPTPSASRTPFKDSGPKLFLPEILLIVFAILVIGLGVGFFAFYRYVRRNYVRATGIDETNEGLQDELVDDDES